MLRLYGRNWHDVENNAIYIKATFTQHEDYFFIHSKKIRSPENQDIFWMI